MFYCARHDEHYIFWCDGCWEEKEAKKRGEKRGMFGNCSTCGRKLPEVWGTGETAACSYCRGLVG